MKFPSRAGYAPLLVFLAACGFAPSVLAAGVLGEEQRFSTLDMQKKKVDLGELLASHKAVLVNFWATWCALCKEEIPELARLYSAQGPDDLAIVGVNVAESPKKVQAYAKKLGINYPVVLDRESAIELLIRAVPGTTRQDAEKVVPDEPSEADLNRAAGLDAKGRHAPAAAPAAGKQASSTKNTKKATANAA